MSKVKTTQLKLALGSLLCVIAVMCLTAGVIWASISTSNTQNLDFNTSKNNTQFWQSENTGIDLSTATAVNQLSAVTSGNYLYVSATNNGVAVEAPCVLRIATTAGIGIEDNSNWILQDNGWYYYNQLVGNGQAEAILIGQVTSNAGNVVAELMQYSATRDGFARYWSPLAGRSASARISTGGGTGSPAKTVDGQDFVGNDNALWGAYKGTYSQEVSSKEYVADVSQANLTLNDAMLATVPAIQGSTLGGTGTYNGILNVSSIVDNVLVYSNSIVPTVMLVDYTYEIYQRNENGTYSPITVGTNPFGSVTITIGASDNGDGTNFTEVDARNLGGSSFIYNELVMPGEYVPVFDGDFNVKIAVPANANYTEGQYAIRILMTITMEDVDTFSEKMEILVDDNNNATYIKYARYLEAYQANAGNNELHSKYFTWLKALVSDANQALGKSTTVSSIYTKLSENEASGQDDGTEAFSL